MRVTFRLLVLGAFLLWAAISAAWADGGKLSGIGLSEGTLAPSFSPDVTSYTARVPLATTAISLTASPVDPTDVVTINAQPANGVSVPMTLVPGDNTATVAVSGGATYSVKIHRGDAPPPMPVARAFSVRAGFEVETQIPLAPHVTGKVTSYATYSAPLYGTLKMEASGTAIYLPGEGFLGEDGFAYTATGPGGSSDPAFVTIHVSRAASGDPANDAEARGLTQTQFRQGQAALTAGAGAIHGRLAGWRDGVPEVTEGPHYWTQASAAGRSRSFTFGGDTFVSRTTRLGLALSYDAASENAATDSHSKAEAVSIAGYGQLTLSHGLTLEALAGLGAGNLDSRRWSVEADESHSGTRDMAGLFASLRLSRALQPQAGLLVTPFGELSASHLHLSAYEESGTAATYAFDAASMDMFTGGLGLRLERQLVANWGDVVPGASVSLLHDFSGGFDQRLGYDNGYGWVISSQARASDGLAAELGVSGLSRTGWRWRLGWDYAHSLGGDGPSYDSGALRFGLSRAF